jgi:hypothetical protein
LRKLPEIPQGYLNNGVEVLIKIKKQIWFFYFKIVLNYLT